MTSVPGLRVQLSTPENELFEGVCTDLDSNQKELVALVAFAPEHAPAIALGDRARLAFLGGGLVSSIDAEGTTVLRTDDPVQRCYSFQLGQMPKTLLLLLANRRGATRLAARGGVRLHVLDLPRELLPGVRLHDISASGLSILVEPALEKALLAQVHIRLSLALPGERPFEVTTAIRHRRIFRSQVLYGLELDGRAPDFLRSQERFLSFLAMLR